MKKIIAWLLVVVGVVGGFYSILGHTWNGAGDGIGGSVAMLFWSIFIFASLGFINLGTVILREKTNGVYGAFSIVFALLMGAISAMLLWFIFGPR